MMTDKTNQKIKLKDGRTLGYDEYGSPDGKPVFVFHGTPSSRLAGRFVHEAGIRLKARCAAIDRPGIGLSDFKPRWRILDWPDDVTELADALEIDRFAVLGVSGGGPHAAACAFKIPQRLTKVAIISGVSPYDVPGVTDGMNRSDRLGSSLARRAPWLFTWLLRVSYGMMARSARRNPDGFISGIRKELPESDKAVLDQPEVRHWLVDSFLEAVRSGTQGAARDYSLLTCKWGFRPQDISIEVYLWHGEVDNMAPPAMGRYMANNIPNCQARFLPNEGHISLLVNHAEEIMSKLVT